MTVNKINIHQSSNGEDLSNKGHRTGLNKYYISGYKMSR